MVDARITDARQRGAITKQQVSQGALVQGGAQQASFGAANLDIGFGSPLDAVYEGFANMERDLRQTDRNTASEVADLGREKKNFLDEAEVLRMEAGSSRREGANAKRAGLLGMITSAATGAADIYASIQ